MRTQNTKSKKIKCGLLAVMIMASFSSASYAATAIGGSNTGTINLAGQLAAATCTVALDKTTVSFGNITANAVKNLAQTTLIPGAKGTATFTLTDCPAGTIKLALNTNAIVPGFTDAGKVTIGGLASDAFFYRVQRSGSTGANYLHLNNTITHVNNSIAVTGANNVAKSIPLDFQLYRGSGSLSGVSGAIAGTVSYTMTYQ